MTIVIDEGWSPIGGEDGYRHLYEEALLDAERRVRAATPPLVHTTALRHGHPAVELIEAGRSAALVVIGGKRVGAFSGLVRGSLGLRIAGASNCPTVVVPAGWQETGGSIVVGLADDESSAAAVQVAAREAERWGRRLDVVHAWQVPTTIALENAWEPFPEFAAAHRERLEAAVAGIRAEFPALQVRGILEQGPALEAIAAAADGADLIVVGSHGRNRLARVLLGSVSHDLVLNLPCPVMVVPLAIRE